MIHYLCKETKISGNDKIFHDFIVSLQPQIRFLHHSIFMEENKNKYISVAYNLYAIGDEKPELVEIASAEKPFSFISGFGITLKDFEKELVALEADEEFNFTLTPEQAYGEYVEERIIDLDKDIFNVDGHFDREHIKLNAIIPLENQEGDRFMGRVLDITDDKVIIDLNHPLAGKKLNFKGSVIENRLATDEEIKSLIDNLCGKNCEGCGNGCEGCGSGCGCC